IQWQDFVDTHPHYSGPLAGWRPFLIGNAFNTFQLWTLNQDGTEEETIDHVGRHELSDSIPPGRNDDFNLVPHSPFDPWVSTRLPITASHQPCEDPRVPGDSYGIDCREFDTHAAGQVVRLRAASGLNANEVVVDYVTHRDTQSPTLTPGPNHSGFYRDPLALSG